MLVDSRLRGNDGKWRPVSPPSFPRKRESTSHEQFLVVLHKTSLKETEDPSMSALPDEYPREERTVGRILARGAAELGDTALIVEVGGDTISYRQMDERATRVARGLASLGIKKGDPVLFMMPDGIDLAALWCGLARCGAPKRVHALLHGAALCRSIGGDPQYPTTARWTRPVPSRYDG